MIPAMYDQLRGLAINKLSKEPPGHSLNATALVHEAYLRLAREGTEKLWNGRGQFYVAAAEAMRRIMIDRARRKKAARHGGEMKREVFDSIVMPSAPDRSEELLALDEALEELAKEDDRKAKLVQIRYFVGLNLEESAEVLGISKATAKRDWVFARAWLHHRISESLS